METIQSNPFKRKFTSHKKATEHFNLIFNYKKIG